MCSSLLLRFNLAKLFLSYKQGWPRVSHNYCCCFSAVPSSSSPSSSSTSSCLAVCGLVMSMSALLCCWCALWVQSKSTEIKVFCRVLPFSLSAYHWLKLHNAFPVKDPSDLFCCLLALSVWSITDRHRSDSSEIGYSVQYWLESGLKQTRWYTEETIRHRRGGATGRGVRGFYQYTI